MSTRLLLSILFVSLGIGCAERDVSRVDIQPSSEQQTLIPVSVTRDIDILFVIDDSGSMRQEQESLSENFPEFMRKLEGIEGGLPNVHIGVVSSNVGTGPSGGGGEACSGNGDNGILQVPAGCQALTDGKRYIVDELDDETGQRRFNYAGTLEQQFSCMAQLGTGGCGFEQHLESMKRALSNSSENAGFLRDDAFLAVIFVQDEDDCSAADRAVFDPSQDDRDAPLGELSSFRCFEFGTECEPSDDRTLGPRQNCQPDESSPYMEPVGSYVSFLKSLKSDPSKIMVASITGDDAPVVVGIDPEKDELWTEPVCVVCPGGGDSCSLDPSQSDSALVAAQPAVRMRAFLDAFPQRSTWQNICHYNAQTGRVDLAGALNQIASTLIVLFGDPCLQGRLAEPHQCEVADVRHRGQPNEEQLPLQPCSESSPPCWQLVPDPTCATESQVRLEITRDAEPPADTTVVARCLLE